MALIMKCNETHCQNMAKWSGLCESCYLETYGSEPGDVCEHGNDPNHVPCMKCFNPKPGPVKSPVFVDEFGEKRYRLPALPDGWTWQKITDAIVNAPDIASQWQALAVRLRAELEGQRKQNRELHQGIARKKKAEEARQRRAEDDGPSHDPVEDGPPSFTGVRSRIRSVSKGDRKPDEVAAEITREMIAMIDHVRTWRPETLISLAEDMKTRPEKGEEWLATFAHLPDRGVRLSQLLNVVTQRTVEECAKRLRDESRRLETEEDDDEAACSMERAHSLLLTMTGSSPK